MKFRHFFSLLLLAFAPNCLVAQTPVTFLTPRTFGTGGGQSIAVADFNGDGHLDAATVGVDVNVFLGNGQGSFTTAKPSIGISGAAIVASDFNGDGVIDLAIASSSGLILLAGLGDGTFAAAQGYPGNFVALAVGDFNGDGVPDVAAADAKSHIQVFFGSSAGGLTPGPVTALPTGTPLAVVSADFNRDGKADLAVTGKSGSDSAVSVLFGNGDGTFGAPTVYPSHPGISPALVAGDFRGSGSPDIAYIREFPDDAQSSVSMLLNNGQGVFTTGPFVVVSVQANSMAMADVDGDGTPDLVIGGSGLAVILLNSGTGTFDRSGQYVMSSGLEDLAVADFNGDGIADIVSASGGQFTAAPTLSLILGTGGGKFHSSPAYDAGRDPTGLAVGDFNQDGNLDLAVADSRDIDPVITVWPGDGKGGFGRPASYPADEPIAVAASDLNHDGKPDIVFVGLDCVGSLLNQGDGSFGAAIYSPCLYCGDALLVADLNGDGIPDLLTNVYLNETVYLAVLLGNGDGTFGAPSTIPPPPQPEYVATADFNNDGIPDLAVSSEGPKSLGTYLLFGNGDGTFGAPVFLSFSSLEAVGDFNGDGNIDIAVNGDAYLGNGNGTFTPAFTIRGLDSVALVGDFNGDGILDLIGYGTGIDNSVGGVILLGKGNGDFVAEQQQFPLPASGEPSGFPGVSGDFTNSGRLDIAVFGFQTPVWMLFNTTGR